MHVSIPLIKTDVIEVVQRVHLVNLDLILLFICFKTPKILTALYFFRCLISLVVPLHDLNK